MTDLEKKFCDLFITSKNEVEAAKEAFSLLSKHDAVEQASFLLARKDIKDYIMGEMVPIDGANVTAKDVTKQFVKIAKDAHYKGDFANANRAIENVAKILGLFVDKKEIKKVVENEDDLDETIEQLNNVIQLRAQS